MGYVPPSLAEWTGMFVLSPNTTYSNLEAYRTLYLANAAMPKMVIRPTYESYRHELYGWPTRDWMPFLNYGLLASFIVLVAAIVIVIST